MVMRWLTENWKILSAIVYLLVCIVDFIAFPIFLMSEYTELHRIGNYKILYELFKDDPLTLQIIVSKRLSDWTPYTLRGAGLFHVSFGAILTGTVLNRKKKD